MPNVHPDSYATEPGRTRTNLSGRRIVATALACLCLGLLILATGCENEGAPYEPIVHPIEYKPPEQEILLPGAQFIDFKAVDRTTTQYDVTWLRNGASVAQGPRYRFFPAGYDIDTLTAVVEYPDQTLRRQWRVGVSLPEPVVEFWPLADSLSLVETMRETLFASTNRSQVASHAWSIDGRPAGSDTSLTFAAAGSGTSIVACRVDIDDAVFEKRWKIRTYGLDEVEMPAVENQQITPGSRVDEIHVYWEPITQWYLDIDEYLILESFDGPITRENRNEATVLLRIPADVNQLTYRETLRIEEHEELLTARTVWISVVGVDERGTLGPPAESPEVPLPYLWYISGIVRGERGQPLADAEVVDSAYTYSVRTAEDGSYEIGPYPSSRQVQLMARQEARGDDPGYSRCLAPLLSVEDAADWNPQLIPAYGTDPNCSLYNYNFARYLRKMTATLLPTTDRPNLLLLRWQNYPLKVYVPQYVNPSGVDLQAVSIASAEIWNLLLGETYLEFVPDPEQADVEFRFGLDSATRYGHVQILEPGGGSAALGSVIPEKATVTLYDSIATSEFAESISLHELGHVLGFCTHPSCSNSDYLMYASPDMSREDWPWNAIHPDELNLVRTVRYLPQATDMGIYPVD